MRPACRLFSRGVIFSPACVSLALLSLRKNGALLVVYILPGPLRLSIPAIKMVISNIGDDRAHVHEYII